MITYLKLDLPHVLVLLLYVPIRKCMVSILCHPESGYWQVVVVGNLRLTLSESVNGENNHICITLLFHGEILHKNIT